MGANATGVFQSPPGRERPTRCGHGGDPTNSSWRASARPARRARPRWPVRPCSPGQTGGPPGAGDCTKARPRASGAGPETRATTRQYGLQASSRMPENSRPETRLYSCPDFGRPPTTRSSWMSMPAVFRGRCPRRAARPSRWSPSLAPATRRGLAHHSCHRPHPRPARAAPLRRRRHLVLARRSGADRRLSGAEGAPDQIARAEGPAAAGGVTRADWPGRDGHRSSGAGQAQDARRHCAGGVPKRLLKAVSEV